MSSKSPRVILHVDLDAFYVQVERSLNPQLMGKACAVAQYNPQGDLRDLPPLPPERRINRPDHAALIAVSYEARSLGVKRNDSRVDMQRDHPNVIVVQVPVAHSKADLTIYRNASDRVVQVIQNEIDGCVVEKASIDEVYIDVTDVVGRMMRENGEGDEKEDSNHYSFKRVIDDAVCYLAGDENDVECTLDRSELRSGGAHSRDSSNNNNNNGKETSDPKPSHLLSKGKDEGKISSGVSSSFPASHSNKPQLYKPPTIPNYFRQGLDECADHLQNIYSEDEIALFYGSVLCYQIRTAVLTNLGFTCSGGIASNKILAKMASGMNKPAKQTLVPPVLIPQLMSKLRVNRLRGFGGKLGVQLNEMVCCVPLWCDI